MVSVAITGLIFTATALNRPAGIPRPAVRDGARRQVSWLAGFRLAPPSRFPSGFVGAETRRLQLRGQPRLKVPYWVDPSVFPFDPQAFSPLGNRPTETIGRGKAGRQLPGAGNLSFKPFKRL